MLFAVRPGLTAITKADVAKLHGNLTDRPSAANRCLALFDTVWNWALSRDELTGPSPTKGLERNPERSRERYLTPDELRRLGRALRDAETTGVPWVVNEGGMKAKHLPKANRATVVDAHAVAAIRLLLLTGARLRDSSCAVGLH
jgi:integrase